METAETTEVYEFDEFRLDAHERVIFLHGSPQHLTPKEFDTLLLLVRHNGHVLSKEEMMSAIWGETWVEEMNLAKQISRLRKLFHSAGKDYIETLPKLGYRFTAEMSSGSKGSESETGIREAEPCAVAEKSHNARGRLLRFGILTVLLIGAAGFIAYRSYQGGVLPKPAAKIRSMAVLPFEAADGESTADMLGMGMTDALITKLSNLRHTVVRPTSSVRRFANMDPLAAGRELGVDAVLTGNVQRSGQQIRVTVQLVSVADGGVLWASKFDRLFTHVFDIQDSISEQVARSIEPGLGGEQRSRLAKRYTANPQAHQAYVQGRYHWNLRTANGMREAVKHLTQAVEHDPNYALAHAGLADAYSLLADYNAAIPEDAYTKARASALRALELDDTLAQAHTSLAYVNMYYFWDWKAAEEGYRRALELNPNYATAHQWYSEYLAGMGRFDEALVEIRRAKEIDPLSPVINAGEVWILYWAGRYDEAIDAGRKLAETYPNFAEVHEYLKRSYDQKGMYREAIAARQMRRKLVGLGHDMSPALRMAAEARNREEYWRARLEQELAEAAHEGGETFDTAEIYAQLGEHDRAFELLEKAFKERTYTMMYIRIAPNLESIRSDPRYGDLVKRIGLP